MARKNLMRKALSSIIGGIIITGLAVIILGTLFTIGLQSARKVQEANNLANMIQYEIKLSSIAASENVTGSTAYLTLKNVGPVKVMLKWLILDVGSKKVAVDLYGFVKNPTAMKELGLSLVKMVNAGNYSVSKDVGSIYVDPGGYVVISMPASYKALDVVTVDGKVISITNFAANSSTVSKVSTAASSVIVWPINLADVLTGLLSGTGTSSSVVSVNPQEIQQPTQNSLGVGMERYGKHLVLVADLKDVNVTLYGYNVTQTWWGTTQKSLVGFMFGNAYIGLDPVWTRNRVGPAKYVVALTTYDPGCSYCNIMNVTFPNGTVKTYHMDSDFPLGWRLVIKGFTPDKPQDIWLRYYVNTESQNLNDIYKQGAEVGSYYINVNATGLKTLGLWWLYGNRIADASWLWMKGKAEEVLIYADEPGEEQFSYRPFFYVMDVDNDGIPEFVFATEDDGFGWAGTCNDYVVCDAPSCTDTIITPIGIERGLLLDDWSVKPFWVNITNPAYLIPGNKYAMVTVTIRIYFHDNLGDDIQEVDFSNRVLFGIYLINSEGKIVNSREYDYQELSVLEDTFPPNQNFFTMTVSLLVPNTNDTYHIGIMFQDPYDDCYHTYYHEGNVGYDDGDFIMAIEWLGLTFYSRP